MNTTDTPIEQWADRVESVLEALESLGPLRVVVLAETASTQDAALEFDREKQGIVCITGRQTGGRGRLGRVWADDYGLGVSMTLGLRLEPFEPHLPLSVGIAVAEALSGLGLDGNLGVRWPNDVVDRETGRKIAGILIERTAAYSLVGIGINIHQQPADWERAGIPNAISLAQFGVYADRLDVIGQVLGCLDERLAEPADRVIDDWMRLDTLVGTEQTFMHNGGRISGVVVTVHPTSELIVRTKNGVVSLPAATTSLLHGS
ncbi:MAG TPA: biotin--[acetyl-CoA-carboxylase] ligase [Phycisphaerales bacterium]|nr:biotin--[acetyl-CoA-carboxylase] ligase [Phycisphaerales bacterium]